MDEATKHQGLVSILMPAYNEESTVRTCVERVLEASLPDGLTRELIILDDASTDGTGDIVRELAQEHAGAIRAFHQEVNQGKGAAIRRAVEEMSGDYVIIQDADLEYDPFEYPLLLAPILEHGADVVYGSRFTGRKMRRVLLFHHEVGNRFLTFLSNVCTGLNLTDMETCYKAFRAPLIKTIPLRSNRFGIEPEITAKIARRKAIVYEVPISYYGRGYEEGKKIGWKDGVSGLYTIIKYRVVDDCGEEANGTKGVQ
jgi:glycosyltransferase involved in cell wall biosynthesis